MNTEKIQEIASALEEMLKEVENGDMEVRELKNAIDKFRIQLDLVFKMLEAFNNSKAIEGISELQRITINNQVQDEIINFDYKKQKRTIITTLKKLQEMDERIGDEIFLPFFQEIMVKLEPIITKQHPNAGKAMRKACKKFKKSNKNKPEGK